MKKLIYIILLGGLMFTTGCQKDVLDKQPLDKYTDATVWSDANLIEAFLLEQYNYTPVMQNDATTTCNEGWNSPSNRDWSSGGTYGFGNAAQIFGVGLTMDVSDETKYTDGAWRDLKSVKANGITSDGGVMEYWGSAYYTIRNLNEFLDRVPNSPMNADLKKLRIAEARFLRAYNYFAMVKRYGGVPLITKVVKLDDPEDVLFPKRNTEKEIYDFVITETAAIAEDLAKTTEYGRANKWAALALNCRAALYAASVANFGEIQLNGLLGISKSEANSYYQKAYDAANAIITSGSYQLYNQDADKVENFKNIFLKKNNSEAIMARQHGGAGFLQGGFNTWSWDMMECPRPQTWGGGNEHAPYLEMVEEFEYIDGTPGTIDRTALQQGLWTMKELWKGRDPRFYASIWTNGTRWRDAVAGVFGKDTVNLYHGLIKPDGSILNKNDDQYNGIPAVGDQNRQFNTLGIVGTGFGIMKYLDTTADNMIWLAESRTDYLIFRYAEVLLNFAEAAFELGKTGESMDKINMIRQRAGMPNLTSIDREKVRHERKVELAFENHRYWDLRRWRIAETKLTRSFSGLQYFFDSQSGKFKVKVINDVDGTTTPPTFVNRTYYFPITKTRIGANKNLVENPGY